MLENDPIRLESASFCLDFLGSLCVYSVNWSKNAQLTNRFISPGDFFVFYIQNVNKKNYLFEQKSHVRLQMRMPRKHSK